MITRQSQSLDGVVRALAKLLRAALLLATLVAACSLAALPPLFVRWLYFDDNRRENLDHVGATHEIIFALLAITTLAIGPVIYLQSRQFRYIRQADHRERTRETVRIALEKPIYAQCWGPRFSPDHVDERLFFYSGFVVLNWAHAWDDRLVDEAKLRELLKAYFDSEVPRMYWERNGDWHQPRRRWPRRMRFLDIVNEEYLKAIKGGPPARPHEPFAASSKIAEAHSY